MNLTKTCQIKKNQLNLPVILTDIALSTECFLEKFVKIFAISIDFFSIVSNFFEFYAW